MATVYVAALKHVLSLDHVLGLKKVCNVCRASVEQCRTRSLEEVMKAVIMEDIPVDYGPWLSVSPEGLSLLQGLLTRDPTQRLTAVEALQHPWFQRHFGSGAEEKQSSRRNNIVPLMPASPRGASSEAVALRSTLT